ncbi:STAS domain-containing protein [Christensenellaceae bacterium OttesenSCG-928-M15]|nr:STAS domain-containing protein [Christensenellaceae bacterium OttesenSCG-928-M15]
MMLRQMQYDESNHIWNGQLHGELDAVQAPKLLEAMDGYLKEHSGDVVFDCTQLVFVDSMGLGALVKLRKAVEAAGGSIKMKNMKQRIYKLFVITGLEDSFGIEVAQ